MVARPEKDPRDPRGPQAFQKGLVEGHDGRAMLHREIEQRVVRGACGLHRPIAVREAKGGLCVPVALRKDPEFGNDWSGYGDRGIAQEPSEFGFQVHAKLEGHEEGVRVEEDELGHAIRATVRT